VIRGDAAEALAVEFLEARGLRIVARNYRCKAGEVDIIAQSGATTVFVEVRSRRSRSFGGAAESITAAKRRKVLVAARHYLTSRRLDCACRLDVVLLTGEPPRIEWIQDAFGE
jgi:putative endonuclease